MRKSVLIDRRHVLGMLGALPVIGASCRPSFAEHYPDRVLKLTVPFPAGGGADTLARMVTAKMEENLGQRFVIENRAGAGGNIGSVAAVRSDPDGYNLLYGTNGTLAINQTLYASPGFDPLHDLEPVTRLTEIALVVIVNPSVPVNSFNELIDYAKKNPGKLNAATAGNGTTSHLAAELFKRQFGIDWLVVNYRGGAQAMTDMLSGQAHVMIEVMPSAMPHLVSKTLKGLAVTTEARWPSLDLPTVAQCGVDGFSLTAWDALLMPKRSPPAAIARINEAARFALNAPQLQKLMLDRGSKAVGGSPESLKTFMAAEAKRWGDIVREAGARID
ncbi:tripartite tricarboxylate transporter substrate binding protein [Bradyrhizobium manausense]|uniref:Bug family tripartite tricarboxylate transporter substrate binding protein n=1 Tax=Bradyrhizobium manausense TaxID=989370 RepID=UPI001BA604CF|nr:tripartite tricarboxylate transporter substrate binding protein [Bradyrhizobium manausense]MBR0834804.1 tripartite tricarboxylate transporter substrate binding protein [Bradyrhizobium manausense]